MASGKQTPRQKMINLMYLVFIAMMAMNVDREVLRSFEDINITLETTSKLTDQNNQSFYASIAKKAADDPSYAEVNLEANKIKDKTKEFVTYIEGLKSELRDLGSYNIDTINTEKEVNYNALQNISPIVTLFFKGGEKGDKGNEKAQQFVKNIEEYKEFLLSYSNNENDQARISQFFNTEAPSKNVSWVNNKYYEQPLVSALSNLSKLQADARTEEGNIVRKLFEEKIKGDLELRAFKPVVMVPPFVKKGEVMDVSIAFGAYDNTLRGHVMVGSNRIELKEGQATFKLDTSSEGVRKLSGAIVYMGGNGQEVKEPFDYTYEVISDVMVKPPSGGVITADKMNVVYRGIDNPISATVSGASGPVSLSASGGSLSGSNGKYNYRPGTGSNSVTFTVTAQTHSGTTVKDSKEFRIKPIPPARGHIAGNTNIAIPKESLAGQRIRVDWPDFLFDLKADVTSFTVKVPGRPSMIVNGTSMSGAASVLDQVKKGDAVNVFAIKYRTSTGITGEASPVTIDVR